MLSNHCAIICMIHSRGTGYGQKDNALDGRDYTSTSCLITRGPGLASSSIVWPTTTP